ncbi:MAG: hypothetical protein HFF44_04215 [Lawsonibacter sp.]|nr:hypothetical protein [Lawsonibacter sp.]
MKNFTMSRTFLGCNITAQVTVLDEGIHALVAGGHHPHIGAVGIVDPAGNCTMVEFPNHQESAVCQQWTSALSAAGFLPAVVEAGIHYDSLDRDGICAVLALTKDLLESTLHRLEQGC